MSCSTLAYPKPVQTDWAADMGRFLPLSVIFQASAGHPALIHMDVMYARNASLHGQGLFRNVGPLQPYCISTIHGGHVTY